MNGLGDFIAGLIKFLLGLIIIGPLVAIFIVGIGVGALF